MSEEEMRLLLADAWDRGHHAGVLNSTGEYDEPLHDNPYTREAT